ncbi:segment polarity protein dishevelled homolog DVL-3 [Gouania willdenowi]|nr:segment polarity protein dishevelled homolog DVL-3-like [Gouania willdenowi]
MAEQTRVIFYLGDQDTPYMLRVNVPAQRVTLADFKHALNKPHARFFFKSEDDDFGVVKEEISDDGARLPSVNGRAVCWVVSCDSCQMDFIGSDRQSLDTPTSLAPPSVERTAVIVQSRPPSSHRDAQSSEMEREGEKGDQGRPLIGQGSHKRAGSNAGSSQSETSSLSNEDSGGRFNQSTDQSSSSPTPSRRKRRQRRHKTQRMEKSVSFSSVTDSTLSLNIITVTLNLERYSFLGISIVGQSSERGDGGIYIGSIMKGGAVAADGRIEPGDMLLQVNEVNFEKMRNDDAVRILREIVNKPGPITLTVAKCWDSNVRDTFNLPSSEPVRPIDPAAWVSHTAAMTGRLLPHYGFHDDQPLTIHSDITAVVMAMADPESGLEVRDRLWLKINIPNAFIGSDVIDWLLRHLEGFTDRREARKYAANLLKAGYIRHTVNKETFSEQCYYVFRELSSDLRCLSLMDRHLETPPTEDAGSVSSGSDGGDHHEASAGASVSSGLHGNQDTPSSPPGRPQRSSSSAVGTHGDFCVDVM